MNKYVFDIIEKRTYTTEIEAKSLVEANRILNGRYKNNDMICIMKEIVETNIVKEENKFIWKYHFDDEYDYYQFLKLWKLMEHKNDSLKIPDVKDSDVKDLEIHAIIDKKNGTYERWSVCDGVEYRHDILMNLSYEEINHTSIPYCDEMYCFGRWSKCNAGEMRHKYYYDL